jgi:hypothetical protein
VGLWAKVSNYDQKADWAASSIRAVMRHYYAFKRFRNWYGELKLWALAKWESWKYSVSSLSKLASLGILMTGFGLYYRATRAIMKWMVVGGFFWWLWKRPRKVKPIMTQTIQVIDEIEDYCGGKIEQPEKGRIVLVDPSRHKCKALKTRVGFTINLKSLWIPRSCIHNESRALAKRQLLPSIGDPETRRRCWLDAAGQFNPRWTVWEGADDETLLDTWLCRYPIARRVAIKMAWQALMAGQPVNAKTKAFVKREWLLAKVTAKRDPRLISGKHDDYLSVTGPVFHSWTKQIVHENWSTVEEALRHRFIYTGGMTAEMIGAIASHFETLGWYAYEGDYSRYDGHTEVEALEAQMRVYGRYLPGQTVRYLREQLKTVGGTPTGLSFQCKGKTASGVANTSFGNTIMNFLLAIHVMGGNGGDWAIMALGDDNVIFSKHPRDTSELIKRAVDMGHKLEVVERKPDQYDFLEFCSMRFWNVGDSRVLGPKPFRVLSKTFMPHRDIQRAEIPNYVKGIVEGFKHYRWIPILGKVCGWLDGQLQVVPKFVNDNPYKATLKREIDVDSRSIHEQFERVYGTAVDTYEDLIDEEVKFQVGMCLQSHLWDAGSVVDGCFLCDKDEPLPVID